jgi:hypothetical protein
MRSLLIASAVAVLAFGAGLLTGRQFPAHHYQRFGESKYLYDVSTGKVCAPFKTPTIEQDANGVEIAKPVPNPFDSIGATNPLDSIGAKQPDNSPPTCGE